MPRRSKANSSAPFLSTSSTSFQERGELSSPERNEKPPTKKTKRNFSKTMILPKHVLLNAMSPVVCKRYYDKEIEEHSQSLTDGEKGCIFSTKKGSGGRRYPEIYINQDDVPSTIKTKYLKRTWNEDKKLCRVYVHQMAWRSLGHELPNYEDGIDICHTCGEGMAKDCCINRDHLQLGHHKDNLRAIDCQIFTKCPYCQLVSVVCPHNPTCTGDKMKMLNAQCAKESFGCKKITKVTFTFEDGTSETIDQ